MKAVRGEKKERGREKERDFVFLKDCMNVNKLDLWRINSFNQPLLFPLWLETWRAYAFTHLKPWKPWWSDRPFVSLETDDTGFSSNNV